MKILKEILEQLKQINEKLSVMPITHTYEAIKSGPVYCTTIYDPLEYKEKFQAKMNL